MSGERWTPQRKRAVLAEIDAGLDTGEACRRWAISTEELVSWQRNYEHRGVAGLAQKGLALRVRAEA